MPDDPAITLRRMKIADQRWQAAIDDSAFAPPDPGFGDRVRAIAAAAEGEALAMHEAARNPKLRWQPGRTNVIGLSYELRPNGNRPGPAASWTEFDTAVNAVSDAMSGADFGPIGDAFRHLGIVAMRLAGEIDAEREDQTFSGQALRNAG